jgi:two-component system LytT family response regulator
MISAVLIDDEPHALELLEWHLAQHCPCVQVLALCGNARDGIAAIRQHSPGVVFLDIEMPVQNGFDVLAAFDNPSFDVVFVTAYNQYAIQAIRHAAFDYLLKPVDAEELKACVSRLQQGDTRPDLTKVKALAETLRTPARVALHTQEGLVMMDAERIIRCQSVSNYTRIFLDDGKMVMVSRTLKEVEEALQGQGFYRIHHSHLVRLSQVLRFVRTDGGSVEMSDGVVIGVARNRKEGFLERFIRL